VAQSAFPVGPEACRGTGPKAGRIVGGVRRSQPLPKDRRRLPSLSNSRRRFKPCGLMRAGTVGAPRRGSDVRQGPQSGSWLPIPRERGTGASESPGGGLTRSAPILAGKNPIVRGAEPLLSFQRLTLAGIAPLAQPPQSDLRRGVASEEAWMPAPLLCRALAGRLAGALRPPCGGTVAS